MDRNQLITGVDFVRSVMQYHSDRLAAGHTETDEEAAAWAEGSRYLADTTAEIERLDTRTAELARAQQWVENHPQSVQPGTFEVPNVNLGRQGAGADRSLDDLFWATNDRVRADGGNAYTPVDQVVIRSDGGTARPAPRLAEFAEDNRAKVRSFQELAAHMAIAGCLIDRSARSFEEGFQVARKHRAYADQWSTALRAMDVDTSGEGGTWVPTGIGASYHEKVRASGKVAPLFQTVDLPTNPWKWPIEGADATAYRVAEPTSDTESKMTASTPGTVAATFDAEIFGVRALTSKFLEADSAVAIAPFIANKIVQAVVDGVEKAILDGDTDGTHQDSDVGASTTDARTAWDGLRKRALAETTQATTTTSVANLAAIRKSMKKWGVNPMDLAFIVGVSSYAVLMSDSNVLTVDKMGPNATILNGQVASLFGVPIIVSEHVREDLNATGTYDAITTTKTYALCVNRKEWAMGTRTPLSVEVNDSIYAETAQRVFIGFARMDFQSIASASTDDNTSIGYNITSGS